jgi:hypothetical protein
MKNVKFCSVKFQELKLSSFTKKNASLEVEVTCPNRGLLEIIQLKVGTR